MATIITLQASDQITNSRADINTSLANLNSDKIETSVLDTDTALAANSDAKIPSQKAVKTYVDAGGNVNASTTNKGIVEEATAAEVLSLSATGGTSARLFMNPSTAVPIFGIKSVTAGATINGATLPVPVYQNKTDNEFYACDGNDTAALAFIGFAVSNGTDGNSMTVQFNGIVSGFSALDEGEKYYVQDAVGTIGTTVGTYPVCVGRAISTTELLIEKDKWSRNGSFTVSDVGNAGATQDSATITLGFRPRVIRVFVTQDSSTSAVSDNTGVCLWVHGTAVSTTGGYVPSIISVDGTSFVIRITQTMTTPGAGKVVWEAEG